MHIAICDDNVADRKQTERLMGREADRWISEGKPLYVYTYGSLESLISNYMQFDAVFLDITASEGLDTLSALNRLKELGLQTNYVITSETINDGTLELPDDVNVLCKPISTSSLHDLLVSIDERRDPLDSRIELRGEKETVYAKEDDLLYARKEGYKTLVTLKDGTQILVHDSINNFYDEIVDLHSCFEYANRKYIVNVHHISSIKRGKAKMTDGTVISISFGNKKYIEKLLK